MSLEGLGPFLARGGQPVGSHDPNRLIDRLRGQLLEQVLVEQEQGRLGRAQAGGGQKEVV